MAQYAPPSPLTPWPIFDSLQFILLNQTVDRNYVDSTFLKLSGGTMTGGINAININMSGNLTLNSSSLYINSLVMNSTATELNYLSGVTLGTVTASKALTSDSNATVKFLNSNDSILINNTSSTGRSNLKFTNDSNLSLEFGLRGSTASNPSTAYWYMNGNYRMLMNTSGDLQILSTTVSSSTSTGSLTLAGGIGIAGATYLNTLNVTNTTQSSAYTNGSAIFSGGIGVAKKIFCNDSIDCSFLDVNGNGIYLQNGGKTAFISILNASSTNALTLQSQTKTSTSNYSVLNISYDGMLFQRSDSGNVFASATSPIDFGNSLAMDCQINLYGGSYFVGSNSNALILSTGGTNGIYFCTGSSYAVSGTLAKITQQGSYMSSQGIRAVGFDTAGYSSFAGPGAEMHYAASTASFFGYNRSSLQYTACQFGSNLSMNATGQWAVGTSVDSNYLFRFGAQTLTYSGGYGYINSGASTGTGTNTGSVSFSFYASGRALIFQEVDIMSDIRLKNNIRNVSFEEAEVFVNYCLPRHYIKNNTPEFGYISQDILKASYLGKNTKNLKDLVSIVPNEEIEEFIDEDGFKSEAGYQYNISYSKIVTMLHRYILELEERVKNNEKKIEEFTINFLKK